MCGDECNFYSNTADVCCRATVKFFLRMRRVAQIVTDYRGQMCSRFAKHTGINPRKFITPMILCAAMGYFCRAKEVSYIAKYFSETISNICC